MGYGGDIASDKLSTPQGKTPQNAAAATVLTHKTGLEIMAARRALSSVMPITQRDDVAIGVSPETPTADSAGGVVGLLKVTAGWPRCLSVDAASVLSMPRASRPSSA